ncbi:hypothetical protein LCT93_23170, partial [Escherichia coli]|nr:hypothetical protein [Escherichia coli]
GKNSLNRLIRCVCGKKIGPDPRNFNQRVSLGRNDLLIRTFPKARVFSEYIYLCATSSESIERLAHLADGGAYPAVNADVVLSTQCVLPAAREIRDTLLKIFSSRTEVFFSYRANSLSQNELLSNIRDTLLPKLLSGEITLPEAEQAISEVENV